MPRGTHPNSLKNLQPRKYRAVSSFFGTRGFDQGYFAGFLAADGNIAQNGRMLSVSVQRRDRSILEEMQTCFGGSYPIRDVMSQGYPQSVITIVDEELCRDLREGFNITPRKSLTLSPPVGLAGSCLDGFVKGFVDGDGSIGVYQGNELSIGVVGTEQMIQFVSDEWARVTGVPMPQPYSCKDRRLWSVKIANRKAREVFEYYYSFPRGLPRKWSPDKYDLCKNWTWRSKKHTKNFELYQFVMEREDLMSQSEIARQRGCTAANINAVVHSKNYQKFKESKILDTAEEVLS